MRYAAQCCTVRWPWLACVVLSFALSPYAFAQAGGGGAGSGAGAGAGTGLGTGAGDIGGDADTGLGPDAAGIDVLRGDRFNQTSDWFDQQREGDLEWSLRNRDSDFEVFGFFDDRSVFDEGPLMRDMDRDFSAFDSDRFGQFDRDFSWQTDDDSFSSFFDRSDEFFGVERNVLEPLDGNRRIGGPDEGVNRRFGEPFDDGSRRAGSPDESIDRRMGGSDRDADTDQGGAP